MAKEPIWLHENVVQAVHGMQIAEHGGSPGLRDKGLLEAALAKPKQVFSYAKPKADLAAAAAAYACGIIRSHPFIDGNKRAAFAACHIFLELNGLSLDASEKEQYLMFIGLAAGNCTEAELAKWIRKSISK